MVLCMNYVYPGQVATAAMTANVKCMVPWLCVTKEKQKKKLSGPFLWMGLNCKREPLQGGSLRFNTTFPEIAVFILSTSEG